MSRLHPVRGEQVIRALQSVGFELVRQRGSHVFLRYPDGRTTVVPVHRGEILGPGMLRKIAQDVDMHRDAFLELLGSV